MIGRSVQNCHPPASVHIVNKILSRGMFIHIRYFAVYDDQNQYLGTLEVTQNIQPLRELTGEKRIADFQSE